MTSQNLKCINCDSRISLLPGADCIECAKCGKKYPVIGKAIDFRNFKSMDNSEWHADNFDRGYSNLEKVEDGFEHARRSGIPEFIETYRISRCKDFIATWIAQNKKASLLDIGCGTGWYDFRLRDKFGFNGEITGIDVSPHNVNLYIGEVMKRGDDKTLAICSNGEKMPFEDGTFDMAVMTEVIEHVANPSETIQEISRVLKPGGRLIITTPSGPMCTFWDCFFYIPKIIKRVFIPSRGNPKDKPYDVPLSWKELKKYLDSSNFKVIDYHKAIFLPHESYLQFIPIFALKIILVTALLIERLGAFSNFLGLHHIVLAEKK